METENTCARHRSDANHELPGWLNGRPKVDVFARSSDAEFILDLEEADWEWRECQVPLGAFIVPGTQLADNPDEQARNQRVLQWMHQAGGAIRAIKQSPILAIWIDDKLQLLDGWHRMQQAYLVHQLDVFTTLVGIPPKTFREAWHRSLSSI